MERGGGVREIGVYIFFLMNIVILYPHPPCKCLIRKAFIKFRAVGILLFLRENTKSYAPSSYRMKNFFILV